MMFCMINFITTAEVSFGFRFVVSYYTKYPKLMQRHSMGGNFNEMIFCVYGYAV